MKIFNTRLRTVSDIQKAQLAEQQQAGDNRLLDFDTRQHSRFRGMTVSGEAVGVDLPRTGVLKGDDVLISATGELMQVIAKPQAVTKVTADDEFLLMKGAYHLGNRHVPLMFNHSFDQGDAGYALYFENDHVLAQMLENLGLHTESTSVPFEPETGAYQSGQGHSHSHLSSDAHSHPHSTSHSHKHEQGHESGHGHSHPDEPVGQFK